MENWKITGATRVWVHVSHPAAKTVSTALLNKTFRERDLDVVAVAIDVAPDDMPSLIRGMKGWRNLVGMGVTMPHKEQIALVCDELVGLAKVMKAVNIIRRDPDGRLIGGNSDGSGFVTGLRRAGTSQPESGFFWWGQVAPARPWPSPSRRPASATSSSRTAPQPRPSKSQRG